MKRNKGGVVAREFVAGRLCRSYLGSQDSYRGEEKHSTSKLSDKIVVTHEETRSTFTGFLYEAFLPRGYPASVTDDYKAYQMFDSLQAICSSLTGVFAGRAMLKAAGVGNSEATAAAATINWIIRDGASMIGRVLFTYAYSSNLDSNCKTWRFMADIMNDLALFLEILSPYIPSNLYLPVVCIAGILKTLCGITGGATKAALTQHFALNDNLADVNAKDGTQETAVSLVGILLGFIVSKIVDDEDIRMTVMLFIIFTAAHLQFNYIAVKSVKMRNLNRQRLNMQLMQYFAKKSIMSHIDAQKSENVIWFDRADVPIHLGSSLNNIVDKVDKNYLREIVRAICKDHYYIYVDMQHVHTNDAREIRSIHVFLHSKGVNAETLLRAYFQSYLLRHHSQYTATYKPLALKDGDSYAQRLLDWSSKHTETDFADFIEKLKSTGWKTDRVFLDETDCTIADAE